ncbi:hypothetical protein Tco_0004604 [Tanacetum coccineum]
MRIIWISTLKHFLSPLPFLSSLFLWNDFLSSCGCLTNRPRLLKNFLKSLTAMAYSSSSLSEVELSSSLDAFLAFKAIDLLYSLLLLTVSESFLITLHKPSKFP